MDSTHPLSALSSRLRRTVFGANLVVLFLLALAIFAMVNYLSVRYPARFHWNRAPYTRLSGKSLRLLEPVAGDIRIIALLRPSHEAYRSTVTLLQDYAAGAPNVSIELVDPDHSLARTEQLVRQYRLPAGESVVFDIGGRHRTVSASNLIEFAQSGSEAAPPRQVFRGEKLFTSAI